MTARATDHSLLIVRLRDTAGLLDRMAEQPGSPPANVQRARKDAIRYRAVASLLLLHDEQRINLYEHPDLLVWVQHDGGEAIGAFRVENNYI